MKGGGENNGAIFPEDFSPFPLQTEALRRGGGRSNGRQSNFQEALLRKTAAGGEGGGKVLKRGGSERK